MRSQVFSLRDSSHFFQFLSPQMALGPSVGCPSQLKSINMNMRMKAGPRGK